MSVDEWKELIKNNQSLKWILINSLPLYDHSNHIPSFNDYQQLILNRTLTYAKTLNVNKVHLVMTDINNDSDR